MEQQQQKKRYRNLRQNDQQQSDQCGRHGRLTMRASSCGAGVSLAVLSRSTYPIPVVARLDAAVHAL